MADRHAWRLVATLLWALASCAVMDAPTDANAAADAAAPTDTDPPIDGRRDSAPNTDAPVLPRSEEGRLEVPPLMREITLAISADGSRAVLGVPDDVEAGVTVGSASVFLWTGSAWALEARLLASNGHEGDAFGSAVALDATGTRALIGAPAPGGGVPLPGSTNAMSARVFTRTGATWTEEATLFAPDEATFFGMAVTLSAAGDRALVGAPGDHTPAEAQGSARVFVRSGTTWSLEATLVHAAGVMWDALGASVDLDGDGTRAVVGAPGAAKPAVGHALFFARTGTTWALESRFVPTPRLGGKGGISVGMSDDGARAIVGAVDPGVSILVRSGAEWDLETTLTDADDGTNGFGVMVALSATDADVVVVGEPYETAPAGPYQAGHAHVFRRDGVTWRLDETLTPFIPVEAPYPMHVGSTLALSATGARVLVGSSGEAWSFALE